MAAQHMSDLELVNDALNMAYPQVLDTRDTVMSTESAVKLKALPSLIPTKTPRATWLDHTVPVPVSSSPMSNSVEESKPDEAGLETRLDGVLDSEWVGNDGSGTMKSIEIHGTSMEIESSSIGHDPDLDVSQVAYMSGAIQDSLLVTRIEDHRCDFLQTHPVDQESEPAHTPVAVQPRLKLRLPKIGQSLQAHAEALDEQSPDEIDIETFEEHALRRALRLTSPELSKKSQWHAWKRTEEMLDMMGPEEVQRWSMSDMEKLRNDVFAEDKSEGDLKSHMWSEYSPVLSSTIVMTTVEQRQHSVDSAESVEMEISPEDAFIPQVIYCHQSMSCINPKCDVGVENEHDMSELLEQQSTISTTKDSTRTIITGKTANEDTSFYNKDHRGYYIRPVQTPTASEQDIPYNVRTLDQDPLLKPNHANTEPITPPRYHSIPSHNFLHQSASTPPTNHSPGRMPKSPIALALDKEIRPSVERDLEPQSRVRESTPAYIDRSFTPSPASHTGNNPNNAVADLEMADKQPPFATHSLSRDDPPRSPRSPSIGPMLPPPHPVRSLTNSPSGRIYDPASPSVLRSPAIMRVMDQIQFPKWDTLFPGSRCSRSPSPSLSLSLNSNPGSSLKPPSSTLRQETTQEPGLHDLAPANPPPAGSAGNVQPLPLIPAPPPIPGADGVGLVKQRKANGRRKPAVHDAAAKVGKVRSVTGGNGAVRGKRVVMVGKKQRTVTVGLAKALDVDVPDLEDVGADGHERMNGVCNHTGQRNDDNDDKMELDEDLHVGVNVREEAKVSDQSTGEQQLRRSMRLRTGKR